MKYYSRSLAKRLLFVSLPALFIYGCASNLNDSDRQEIRQAHFDYYEGKLNNEQAKRTFLRTAIKGHSASQHNLAMVLISEGEYEKALMWFKKAAQSNRVAQFALARFFANAFSGHELAKYKSEVKTFNYLTDSAENGYDKAQMTLSTVYAKGYLGQKTDSKKAYVWMERAARNNNAEAQFLLANMYLTGQYTSKDEGQTFHWLNKAHDQLFSRATLQLGIMYAQGIHVKKNYQKAFAYFEQAAQDSNKIYMAKYAWILSTARDDHLRKPGKAISMIKPMMEFAKKTPSALQKADILSAIAAVLADNHDFVNAVKVQQQLVRYLEVKKGLHKHNLLTLAQRRLSAYSQRTPWRELVHMPVTRLRYFPN